MNVLNTIKKFFETKTSNEKNEFSMTSANQVIDMETKFYVDEKLDSLKRYCDTLSNFVTPQVYNFSDTSKVSMGSSLLNIVVIGKLVVITGAIYTKSGGGGLSAGENPFDMPVTLKPISNEATVDEYIRFSGNYHRIVYGVNKANPNKLRFYTADAIPEGQTIPIFLVYVVDDTTNWTGA